MRTVTATAKVKCLVHMPDRAFAISHHFSRHEKKVGRDIILQGQPWPITRLCPLFCIISSREYRGRLEQSGLRLGQIG